MNVEIWSDIICPWCYIGKRRFEMALAHFPHRNEVQVFWRSFELDPEAPRRQVGSSVDLLMHKYGLSREQAVAANARVTQLAAEEGLSYRLDLTQPGNSFDAHRLLHLGAERRLQGALQERLFAAYFSEGASISDPVTLVHLATEVGMDGAEVRATLASDAYAEQVRADEREASALGISGVPFFVFDRRYGVSGAQPAAVFLRALERAWKDAPQIEDRQHDNRQNERHGV